MLTNSTCWVLEGNLYSSFTIHLYTKDVWNAMYFMRQITYQLIAGIQPSKVTNGFLINPPNAQNTPQWKRTYMIEKDRYHASKHQKCYVLTVTACVFVRYRCNLSVFVCVWGYQPPAPACRTGQWPRSWPWDGELVENPCPVTEINTKILMKMKCYTWANLSLLRTAYFNVMKKGLYSRSIKRSMTLLQCVDSRVTNWCFSWMSPVKQHFIMWQSQYVKTASRKHK